MITPPGGFGPPEKKGFRGASTPKAPDNSSGVPSPEPQNPILNARIRTRGGRVSSALPDDVGENVIRQGFGVQSRRDEPVDSSPIPTIVNQTSDGQGAEQPDAPSPAVPAASEPGAPAIASGSPPAPPPDEPRETAEGEGPVDLQQELREVRAIPPNPAERAATVDRLLTGVRGIIARHEDFVDADIVDGDMRKKVHLSSSESDYTHTPLFTVSEKSSMVDRKLVTVGIQTGFSKKGEEIEGEECYLIRNNIVYRFSLASFRAYSNMLLLDSGDLAARVEDDAIQDLSKKAAQYLDDEIRHGLALEVGLAEMDLVLHHLEKENVIPQGADLEKLHMERVVADISDEESRLGGEELERYVINHLRRKDGTYIRGSATTHQDERLRKIEEEEKPIIFGYQAGIVRADDLIRQLWDDGVASDDILKFVGEADIPADQLIPFVELSYEGYDQEGKMKITLRYTNVNGRFKSSRTVRLAEGDGEYIDTQTTVATADKKDARFVRDYVAHHWEE